VDPIENDGDALSLICFVDEPERAQRNTAAQPRDESAVAELERELKATQAELEATLHNLDVSNQEQKAINEEALSVNEEFQTANEELLTSKEELQSLNEELVALNSQLQETLELQRTTASDLENILRSTDVATFFLDADLNLLPGALAKLAALTGHKAVHSVCPWHRIEKPFEQLSAYFNAITLAGVDAFATTPSSQATLFGQVLLIHRDHYRQAGGHHAVRNEILENFQLANLLQKSGIGIQHYLGQGVIEMRMFPEGMSQLIRSWKKGFLAGATQAPKRALLTTSLWLTGGMTLIGCLASIPFLSTSYLLTTLAACLAYSLLSFHAFRLAGNFSFLTALFFPVPLLFYQYLFFKSLLDQKKGIKSTWKGRILE
jgi:hypothetical protein